MFTTQLETIEKKNPTQKQTYYWSNQSFHSIQYKNVAVTISNGAPH